MTLREQVDATLAQYQALRPKLSPQIQQLVDQLLGHLQPKDPKPGSFWQDPVRAAAAKQRMSAAGKARWAARSPTLLACAWGSGHQEDLTLAQVAQRVGLSPQTLLQRLSATPILHLTDLTLDDTLTITRKEQR